MILRTVENALKNVYLEVLSNEIRTRTSPFFSKILTTLKDVWGKEILFTSIEENYKTYKTPLITLLYSFDITDKTMRACENNTSVLADFLNTELENFCLNIKKDINKQLLGDGKEGDTLLGLGYLFNNKNDLYGVKRDSEKDKAVIINCSEEELLNSILTTLDEKENDLILCNSATKRIITDQMLKQGRSIKVIEIENGFKGIDLEGCPLVHERLIKDGEVVLLNTRDFELKQLCDWSWLENTNGDILFPYYGKPVYRASLVKYCQLICKNLSNQVKIIFSSKKL